MSIIHSQVTSLVTGQWAQRFRKSGRACSSERQEMAVVVTSSQGAGGGGAPRINNYQKRPQVWVLCIRTTFHSLREELGLIYFLPYLKKPATQTSILPSIQKQGENGWYPVC